MGQLQHPTGVVAFHVVHHQVLTLPREHEVVGDARQAGMAQGSQQAGLALELPGGILGDEEVLLDGYLNLQIVVVPQVDRAHAPASERRLNAVTVVEQDTGFERHADLEVGETCRRLTRRPPTYIIDPTRLQRAASPAGGGRGSPLGFHPRWDSFAGPLVVG